MGSNPIPRTFNIVLDEYPTVLVESGEISQNNVVTVA
jgi:hypothetical protein